MVQVRLLQVLQFCLVSLNCKEFVNADSIAAGLSPFNPEGVAIEAGRLMLARIDELLRAKVDFALETTLATRSYLSLIKNAQLLGYKITLLYFWLDSPKTAKERVATRVANGGHNIPDDVIERRYYRGIFNLINLFMPVVDSWMILNGTNVNVEHIAEKEHDGKNVVGNEYLWYVILEQSKKYGHR